MNISINFQSCGSFEPYGKLSKSLPMSPPKAPDTEAVREDIPEVDCDHETHRTLDNGPATPPIDIPGARNTPYSPRGEASVSDKNDSTWEPCFPLSQLV